MSLGFDETLKSVAETLVANCRAHREMEGLAELYAPDAVSVEAIAMDPNLPRETVGVDAIRGKHEWWKNTFDVSNEQVVGPYLYGDDRFSVIFNTHTVHRESGEASDMSAIGVYTVRDGKIAREEFFYAL